MADDWSTDSAGRSNHERVGQINQALQAVGFQTWFDADRMKGDIVHQMTTGIDHSCAIAIFVTPAYISKVAGRGPRGDNDKCPTSTLT